MLLDQREKERLIGKSPDISYYSSACSSDCCHYTRHEVIVYIQNLPFLIYLHPNVPSFFTTFLFTALSSFSFIVSR